MQIHPEEKLETRLAHLSAALNVEIEFDPDQDKFSRIAQIIHELVSDRILTKREEKVLWWLVVAITGRYPGSELFAYLKRCRSYFPHAINYCFELIRVCEVEASSHLSHGNDIEIVENAVLLDVTFSASSDHNTGIQRVVRLLAQNWIGSEKNVTLVCWDKKLGGFRRLRLSEMDRVINWSRRTFPEDSSKADSLILPMGGTVFLAEVPMVDESAGLISLASSRAVTFSGIGYDFIPITSRNLLRGTETTKFLSYLSLVKNFEKVATISNSACNEFAGFNMMLAAQAKAGPQLRAIPLPAVPLKSYQGIDKEKHISPLLLMVGSIEARKNHSRVLDGAEELWREGFRFTLLIAGSWGSGARKLKRRINSLRKLGFDISVAAGTSDLELADLYHQADIFIFPSVHEGFGLPLVEALSVGTPAITTNYGSLAEIAANGGCVVVNPYSVGEIKAAIAKLLSNDEELAALGKSARERVESSWEEYSEFVWEFINEKTEIEK